MSIHQDALWQHDAFGGPYYSGKPTWAIERNRLRLSTWRDRWCSIEREFYESRDIGFAISSTADATIMATGTFAEWTWGLAGVDPDKDYGLPDLDCFVQHCDRISQTSYAMAEAVRHAWGEVEADTCETPLHYGNIVLFNRLRIERLAAIRSVAIWQLIRDMIAREFYRRGSRQCSIIVLKAFPLEYEGGVTSENQRAFERRQAAMIRHYRHRLGALPFDGGEPGWLWINIHCPLPPKAVTVDA